MILKKIMKMLYRVKIKKRNSWKPAINGMAVLCRALKVNLTILVNWVLRLSGSVPFLSRLPLRRVTMAMVFRTF